MFKHAYSESFRGSDLECKDASLTQQQFKDDVDINVLLERFQVTGMLPSGVRLPSYGDFTGVSDFSSAMSAVVLAQDSFMQLPASLRARFGNSPQAFLEFCSDPSNKDEIVKLGLSNSVPVKQDQAKPDVAAKAA